MDIRRIIRKLVQEAYSAKHNANIYFPTFSEAVQHAREVAEKKGFTIDENDWFNQVTMGAGRPSVDEYFTASIGLEKDGKPVKNARLQIQVYGMDNSFELKWMHVTLMSLIRKLVTETCRDVQENDG